MTYALRGSSPPVSGSRHARSLLLPPPLTSGNPPSVTGVRISWAPSPHFVCGRGSGVRPLFCQSTRMEAGEIQRGKGGSFSLGGTGSMALRVWKLSLALLRSSEGWSLSRNSLLTLSYRVWQRVGRWMILSLRAKWSDENFCMLWIPTSSKRCRSVPIMW